MDRTYTCELIGNDTCLGVFEMNEYDETPSLAIRFIWRTPNHFYIIFTKVRELSMPLVLIEVDIIT